MHLNYYFLRFLTYELANLLLSAKLVKAFSQSKDELMIEFETKSGRPFFIRASLTSNFSCLSFPDEFKRSRKNSIDLFTQLKDGTVHKVQQFKNERAFLIEFESGLSLLFKLHGNRSNILLVSKNEVLELFKRNLANDNNLDVEGLDRKLDQSLTEFQKTTDLNTVFPTFGKVVKGFLVAEGYHELEVDEKWGLLKKTEGLLNQGRFYLCEFEGAKPVFSLLKLNNKCRELSKNPIEAINEYYRFYTKTYYLKSGKDKIVKHLTTEQQRIKRYVKKAQNKLDELKFGPHPKELGDIIMANLHAIETGVKEVELFNFYNDKYIKVRLNKELTPQKNAENYYRKGKNRVIEEENLSLSIKSKSERLKEISRIVRDIDNSTDLKELKALVKKHDLSLSSKSKEKTLPYKEFLVNGFRVWVGKNAKANDELSLKYRYKEDLWLHAKDVPGSHVLIKHRSDKKIDENTILRVAGIAAYYSKRKTDSLAPVIYTPAKYIRKPKGSPPGSVVVEREKVILVKPTAPEN